MKIPKKLEAIKTDNNKHFIENGIYFGYPTCCIVSFVKGLDKLGSPDRFTFAQELIMDNSGFIPCHSCSIKLIKNKLPKSFLLKKSRKEKEELC